MKAWLPRSIAIVTLVLGCITSASFAQTHSDKLRIYFIDVEGGQSTLFVTPQGESLLIDAGWPGNCAVNSKGGFDCSPEARDADRIVAAAKKAGLSKIDYVLITHYHVDHAGGIPPLVARIPVGTFIDHGPNSELDKGITEKDYADYQKLLATGKYKVLEPKPGDILPIKGFKATVISSDGNLITNPLPGAGQQNSYCQGVAAPPADQTENSHSLGIQIDFGKLRLIDLGDLTRDKEFQLACPANKLGHIDVYIVSHHGWDQSSSAVFVDAIHPRVAIMDNGAKKGGSTSVLKTIEAAPGLETLWQLHYSEEGGPANNTKEPYIANLHGPDSGYGLELSAGKDGSFDVTNIRTGATKHYAAK
jgi:beta-lactamase superfamily II metal-dependent hydrolase